MIKNWQLNMAWKYLSRRINSNPHLNGYKMQIEVVNERIEVTVPMQGARVYFVTN
ncbi:MAG: hypothetical protein U9R60_10770 [Bacteroidota bacterium]|nr:hypothetical protein [Bacteroidota bacterium]